VPLFPQDLIVAKTITMAKGTMVKRTIVDPIQKIAMHMHIIIVP
jgi:hypothetical protein